MLHFIHFWDLYFILYTSGIYASFSKLLRNQYVLMRDAIYVNDIYVPTLYLTDGNFLHKKTYPKDSES